MTYKQLYLEAKRIFSKAELDSPAFDAMCLFEKVFGMNRQDMIMQGEETPNDVFTTRFKELVEKRKNHYPLQYLVGEWTFMECDFLVGEGVLIPREDTRPVVELALDFIEKNNLSGKELNIIDLCSGSGAIGINIAKLMPKSKVIALEYSKEAFEYLQKNIHKNNVPNCTAIFSDVLKDYNDFEDEFFNVIISNPPYIEKDIIKTLQPEVQNEPVMALNGGADGLDFYKSIVKNWTTKLKSKGIMVFELGETQDMPVRTIMDNAGFTQIEFSKDIQGINRGVMGVKNNS